MQVVPSPVPPCEYRNLFGFKTDEQPAGPSRTEQGVRTVLQGPLAVYLSTVFRTAQSLPGLGWILPFSVLLPQHSSRHLLEPQLMSASPFTN